MRIFTTDFFRLAFVIIFGSLTFYAQSEPTVLELKKPVEREITTTETHIYKLSVPAQNYAVVGVIQKVDVIVNILDSNRKKIQEVDNPFGIQLAETIRRIPETDTEYFLEVKILDPKSKPGKYIISLEILRPATDEDKLRMEAENAFAEGDLAANKNNAQGNTLALEKFNQALPLFQKLKDQRREHYVIDRIGTVYARMGDKRKSMEYHLQALELARRMNDKVFIARSLDSVAASHYTQGEGRKAIIYWTEGLEIYKEQNDRGAIATALNNIAAAYNSLGEAAKSLEYLRQVLVTAQELNLKPLESAVLRNIAVTQSNLGQPENALEYLEKSLAIAKDIKSRAQEGMTLNSLGATYSRLGNEKKAIEYYNQTLELQKQTGNKFGQVGVLIDLGYLSYKLKDYPKALEYFNQGVEINKELNLRNLEASLQYQTGLVHAALKDYPKARDHFIKARESFAFMETKVQKFRADYMLAQIDMDEGKLDEAQAKMIPILDFFESARKQFIQPEQRSMYFSSAQSAFDFYMSLLVKKHQNGDKNAAAEAFQISERTHARSLLEMLSKTKIDVRQNAAPELVEREKTLFELINDRSARLTRLLSGKFTEAQKKELENELEGLRNEYKEVEGKLLASNKRYAELVTPSPLSLDETQKQVLDADTILLEYSLGEEKSWLFAITQNSLQIFELPKRSEIESKARPFFEALTARNKKIKFETAEEKQARIAKTDAELTNLSDSLAQMILAPAQNLLTKKRLLIVADDILQYIPFASLPLKNKQPLIANYEIISLPSASTLAVLRKEFGTRKPAAKTVAVLADPVFSVEDERFKIAGEKKANQTTVAAKTRGIEEEFDQTANDFNEGETSFNFSRLPFTRKEAEAISTLTSPTAKKLSLDFSANRSNATNPDLANYKIIHFATHSFLNSRRPELSGIVLSLIDENGNPNNGFLRTDEIYNLNLPAELVVLSGCRTGLGKEIRGEGLVGLTRGFMYAGAKRVAVSLWDVNDEATAELMSRFYKEMLSGKKLSPAEALRQAQLSMSKDKHWSNPYYWAGFILQGEPK